MASERFDLDRCLYTGKLHRMWTFSGERRNDGIHAFKTCRTASFFPASDWKLHDENLLMKVKCLTIARTTIVLMFLIVAATADCIGQSVSPDLSEVALEQLGNIKVYSASKHLQPGGDAPSSVTVITANDIQLHGYRTLADILQGVRGFFVTNDRNYSSVGVRGFARPGDYNTRVLVLIDGHRLNDNVYDQAPMGTEFPVDLDLIQRVEIIRGPVSSLYGSNAIFAVINVITRRGEDLNGLELSSDASSFDTYKGRISYGRKLRQFDFMLSGTFYGSRGHDRLFFPEFNAPETNFGVASHADDDQVGSTMLTLSSHDFTLQSAFGTREKGIPTGAYGTIFGDAGTRTTDSHTYIDLRYAHTFGGSWDVLARTFYDRYNYQGTYNYASPGSSGPTQINPNIDFADGKWWGVELQATKQLRRNRITAGGEYRDNLRQNQTNYDLNPYSLLIDDKRQSFVGSLYLQDELTIAKSLSLNAGFRYDYYSDNKARIDPRLALIYRPWNQGVFKLIYAEAFRVPNVYERYYYSTPTGPSVPALKPETIRTTEIVWEQGLSTHLWFSTSAFYNSINDLITQDSTHVPPLFANLQDVRSSGLEAELKGQLASGLEGNVSYSFQQTQDQFSGQLLTNSPRNLVKLSLSQPLFRRRLFASLDAQYRSRVETPNSTSISPFTIVNFTLLGRNVGKHVDLSASVYNLLNKKYSDLPSGVDLQAVPQDGRSFRLKMTWHLGAR